jgi:hypothetical protein
MHHLNNRFALLLACGSWTGFALATGRRVLFPSGVLVEAGLFGNLFGNLLFLGGVDLEGLVGVVAFPDFEGPLGGVAFLGMAFGFLPWLVFSSSVLANDPGVDSSTSASTTTSSSSLPSSATTASSSSSSPVCLF